MATRVCPNCGSQYVASVRRCIDCDVMLIDEVGPGGDEPIVSTATPLGAGDQIAYELEGWGSQLKVTLEGMLDRAGIVRVWEAGALVVPALHEDEVDQLVATVEGGEVVELDDDAPQIAFEIEGLTIDELSDLDARLIAAHIAHAWEEGGALLVGEDDEATVAEMIDEVLDADPQDEDDGLALHGALDALFVAVDKLMKDPADAKLIARFDGAAAGITGLGVPYGLSGEDWERLVSQVDELRARVVPKADGPDEDADADEDVEVDDQRDANPAEPPEPELIGDAAVDDGDGADGEAVDAVDADEDEPAPLSAIEVSKDLARALRARLHDLV